MITIIKYTCINIVYSTDVRIGLICFQTVDI
nr:MAG TPA: hypothetical protein [Caudoviricetes sp.]